MFKPSVYLPLLALTFALPLASFASPASDQKIEEAVRSSYNYRTMLANNVTVKSVDGVVTLTGTVEDKDDRTLAEGTVESIPGVASVKNMLTVNPAYPEHSDAWMAFKIRSRLFMRSNVSAADTSVAVQDGTVTLTGTAESLAQKELTGVYAREIDWVKSVNNEIVVRPRNAQSVVVSEAVDDASVVSQTKYALLSHESTKTLQVRVTSNLGAVVITGDASSDAVKALVSKLAQDVRGVKSVANNMVVRS